MADSLAEAKLNWTKTFAGLDLASSLLGQKPVGDAGAAGSGLKSPANGKLFRGPAVHAGPQFNGNESGPQASPSDPSSIKKRAYEIINAGGTLKPTDYAGLDTDDVVEVLKADAEAKKKEIKELEAVLAVRARLPDLIKQVANLIEDESAIEAPAIKTASDLARQMVDLAKATKYHDMIALFPAFESSVKTAQDLRAQRPKFEKQAQDTGHKVDKMTDAQLEKLPAKEIAELLQGLLAAGKPKGALFATELRIYKHTKLDKDFVKADEANEKKVVASLAKDKELEAAKKAWDRSNPDAKIKAMQRISDAQCKVYGIPSIEIVRMPLDQEAAKNGFVVEGGYWPDGKIHLNFGPDVQTKSFRGLMTTIFHETAHYYQDSLAKAYTSGKIKPTDPLYAQAALFAANDLAGANINDKDIDRNPRNADEIDKGYRGQPNERHSFKTSEAMANATLKVL